MNKISRWYRDKIVESSLTPFIFLTLAICMRLRLFFTIGIEAKEYHASFIWHLLAPAFSKSWVSLVASTLSMLIIALIFSNLNARFALMRLRTKIPFSLTVILLSFHPIFLGMSPNYISTIFILLSIYPLVASYQHHKPRNYAFKSGVLIGIAGVFQVYALLFLPLFWYGEKAMHGFKTKSFVALVLGTFLVIWNVAGCCFLFDKMELFFAPFISLKNVSLHFPELTNFQKIEIILGLIIVIAFVFLDTQTFMRERAKTQKMLSLLILIVFISIGLHLLYWSQTSFFLFQIITMLSYITAHYFSHANKKGEIYLFAVFLIVLMMLYMIFPIGEILIFSITNK